MKSASNKRVRCHADNMAVCGMNPFLFSSAPWLAVIVGVCMQIGEFANFLPMRGFVTEAIQQRRVTTSFRV